jgi:hypothetical protein
MTTASLLLILAAATAGLPGASSKDELARRFGDAVIAQDRAAIDALTFWPRGTANAQDQEWQRQMADALFAGNGDAKVKSVHVLPVPKDQMLSFTVKGVQYAPPLPPIGKVEVEMEPVRSAGTTLSTSTSALIGERDGRYYLDFAFPSTSAAPGPIGGKGSFHATLGVNASAYAVTIKVNGVAVPTITGGSSQAVVLWASDSPTPDLACLRRGRNTIQIQYRRTAPGQALFPPNFYMKAPGYTRDVFYFEPKDTASGTINTEFELYETMPANYQTRGLP